MARTDPNTVPEEILRAVTFPADIDLYGEVDQQMLQSFLDQLGKSREKESGNIVLTLTTSGGDSELVRRIVLEIERARDELGNRFLFLGKSVVYSAGVTIMSAFSCCDRYLTKDTALLIHGRQLDKTVEIAGPIRASRSQVTSLLAQIETGLELEEAGFERLIGDSGLKLEDVIEKSTHNWYLTAEEALEAKLVAALV